MILEPKKDPTKQAHNAGFIITNGDVEEIIKEFLDEWRSPLAELLPEGQNEEEPPLHQVNGEEKEGADNQDDQSQEHNEDDDDMGNSDHHASDLPPSQEHAQTQTHSQQEEGQSS